MERALSPITIKLREARDAAGLTQTELANKANVRQATISELENGNTRRIEFDVLDRLCRALRIEPGDLLKRKPR